MAAESHPFPSRTRPLSPPAPMVLGGRPPGRVGRRRISFEEAPLLAGALLRVPALDRRTPAGSDAPASRAGDARPGRDVRARRAPAGEPQDRSSGRPPEPAGPVPHLGPLRRQDCGHRPEERGYLVGRRPRAGGSAVGAGASGWRSGGARERGRPAAGQRARLLRAPIGGCRPPRTCDRSRGGDDARAGEGRRRPPTGIGATAGQARRPAGPGARSRSRSGAPGGPDRRSADAPVRGRDRRGSAALGFGAIGRGAFERRRPTAAGSGATPAPGGITAHASSARGARPPRGTRVDRRGIGPRRGRAGDDQGGHRRRAAPSSPAARGRRGGPPARRRRHAARRGWNRGCVTPAPPSKVSGTATRRTS